MTTGVTLKPIKPTLINFVENRPVPALGILAFKLNAQIGAKLQGLVESLMPASVDKIGNRRRVDHDSTAGTRPLPARGVMAAKIIMD